MLQSVKFVLGIILGGRDPKRISAMVSDALHTEQLQFAGLSRRTSYPRNGVLTNSGAIRFKCLLCLVVELLLLPEP